LALLDLAEIKLSIVFCHYRLFFIYPGTELVSFSFKCSYICSADALAVPQCILFVVVLLRQSEVIHFSTQKYFLVLWLWWLGLAVLSVIGLIYRLARIMVPDLSR
jgi:hypothetical protein